MTELLLTKASNQPDESSYCDSLIVLPGLIQLYCEAKVLPRTAAAEADCGLTVRDLLSESMKYKVRGDSEQYRVSYPIMQRGFSEKV